MGILAMLSLGVRTCVAKATTFEDQLKAVRGDITMYLIQLHKCNTEKVVATIRKRAREEVETVPAIAMHGCSIYAALKFIFWELIF